MPEGSAANRYLPSASVTAWRVPMSAGDVTVTVTPGRTAPCASVTVPLSRPCPICADTPTVVAATHASTTPMNHPVLLLITCVLRENEQKPDRFRENRDESYQDVTGCKARNGRD